MEKFVEFFVKYAQTDSMWVAFLALAVYYLLKTQPVKIFEHFSHQRDKEHTFALDLLASGKVTTEASEFLREHLEHAAFKRYYGMSADTEMRNALIQFQREHQRRLSWSQVRRAYPKIRLNDFRLEAKLGAMDHLSRWCVTTLCSAVGAYALFIIWIAAFSVTQVSRGQFYALTAIALMLLFAAVLFSSLNWPYHNTRTVIELMKRTDR